MTHLPLLNDNEPPPPTAAATVSRWRLWAHLLLLLPLPLLASLSGVGRHDTHASAMTESVKGLVMACAFNVAAFGVIFGLAVWLSKTTRDQLLLRVRRPVLTILSGITYSVAIRLAVFIITALVAAFLIVTRIFTWEQIQAYSLANRPDVETVVSIKALKNNPVYYWMMLTVVSFIVAGLREELWRTGSLSVLARLWPRLFANQTGQWCAVAITSIIFGLGHAPMGVLAVGATAVIGFLLGAIMVLHKSIWPAVIAHGMFDATSFAMIEAVGDVLKTMR